MKSILIGIPVLNNLEMTRACLRHLVRNTATDRTDLRIEILILDNGSTDDIARLLRNEFSKSPFTIYYRRNPRNLGVAIAWNQILRFSADNIPSESMVYDYYVIASNDAFVCPDWLQPMVESMESDRQIGWVAALENGSLFLDELIEAHALSKNYRVAPEKPFDTAAIERSIDSIYSKWGGHDSFSRMVSNKGLPLFMPFRKTDRSAVCFMVRPSMVEQIGYFDEDEWPVGVAEDLEYYLRMEKIILPKGITDEIYPDDKKWKSGFCGRSVVHHNWCSTHQGKDFDGRMWGKMREKNWKKKFRKSKKYFNSLLP
ncbi:MAG: glycosyltransferase [Proteobacteria bacterium]|nr:glycosyltransferase [Pseudomonadota bacterium]